MLNITIYRGVKLQKNYHNVLYFASASNFITNYLATYSVGTISNIAQFFDGTNEIVLQDLYENCNYMYINDTNSILPDKFYFIDNYEFVSGGAVKYYLTLDVWHTYRYYINITKSLCIRGHIDAMGTLNCKVNQGRLKSNKILSFNDTNCITNYLIPPKDKCSYGTLIALITTNQTHFKNRLIYHVINAESETNTAEAIRQSLIEHIDILNANSFEYDNDTGHTHYQFEIIKSYFLPNIDFENILKNNTYATGAYTNLSVSRAINVGVSGSVHYGFKMFTLDYSYNIDTTTYYEHFNSFEKFELKSANIYKSGLNQRNFEGKRVAIGTLDNLREIDATGMTNLLDTMTLNLYCLEAKQIEIILEVQNIKINLTSSFEIPYVNDEYLLYLNQNQNQINVSNIQNALNLTLSLAGVGVGVALSPLSAGASAVGAVMGASGAVAKYAVSEASRNAKLDDMKNKFDRIDATNNNCLMSILNGVGAFTIDDGDAHTLEVYERFGDETEIYVNKYTPSSLTISLYNYNYIQFENVAIYGNFTNDIKTQLENILNNGVRIWYEYSKFLDFTTASRHLK